MMHLQGNTIDFDTARIKLGNAGKTAGARRKTAKQGEQFEQVQQQLLQSLQTTLEVDQILSLFCTGLKALLQIDALEYRHNSDPNPIQIGQPALHRCSYRLSHAGSYLGELQFSRQQRFSENELLAIETLLGDAALKAVVNCISDSLRSVDGLYRLGGEEFVVLLNDTSLDAGRMVAERIRKSVECMQFELDGQPIPLTVSIGLSTLRPEDSVKSLINRGDLLMYQAKRGGRNQVAEEH